MKKILLIIALVLCMFQLVVLATEITIGSPAINRGSNRAQGNTHVTKTNPATGTGTIDTIEVWAYASMYDFEVGSFFLVSGSNYSTRDTAMLGFVSAGAKRTFTGLSLEVEEGDFLGFYWTGGNMEYDTTGGSGELYKFGDQIPCTNATFSSVANTIYSIYGTGETAEEEAGNAIFFGMNF